jgi:autotransporter-associated beta strand protein
LVATEVDGRLFDFGGVSSAFTGDLTIAPDGVTAGTIAGRFPSTAGGGIPGGTLTLAAGATLSIRGNAVGTTEIGAVTGAVSSTLAGFAGGGVPADKTWQIGALNTPSVFDGIITDGGGTGGTALTNVIKVGTSSLSLSGANTYTGDTTVQTGMFRTTNDSVLPDATDLFVTTGAFVNLDFSGMDTINTLTLGGVVQAIGTYGATGSGADFIRNDFFSGMGRVNVMMVAVTPILIGDYNDNGIVDAADYTVWRDSLGTGFVLPNRDPANMGNVSADDYTSWVNNFGAVPGAGSLSVQNSVPEPTSLAMMIIVTVSLLGGRLCGRR